MQDFGHAFEALGASSIFMTRMATVVLA